MNSSDDSFEPVDKTGQSVLDLLQKAADATDQNTRQAVESAQMWRSSLKPLVLASISWKATLLTIASAWNAASRGSIKFARR
jgi:hypothetical protein